MVTIIGIAFSGCSDDDDPIPPFSITFSTAELGISSDNTEAEATVTFSRPATVSGAVILSLEPGGLVYGESNDYYASVEPEGNNITLPFVSGDQSVSVTFFAGSASAIETEQTLSVILVEDSDNTFTIGTTGTLSVVFAENFVSPGSSVQLDAGGPEFVKQAFIDLSKQAVSNTDKNTWDLAFLSNGFHVTLNATEEIMARQLTDKTSLAEVTASDTTNFAQEMVIGPFSSLAAREWIDDPSGDLTKTAIAAISENNDDNKVYIVKRDAGNWKKIKVDRSGDNYSIQFADIGSTSFEEVIIQKDDTYNAVFFSLDDQVALFEPEKGQWDFMYGTYTTFSTFGEPIPYNFSDYIVINRNGTESAMVMIDDNTTYEDFDLSAASTIDFSTEFNIIGSSWRDVFSGTVRSDRFYVIKDIDGNIYKLRFTKLTGDDDERGRPSLTYELL